MYFHQLNNFQLNNLVQYRQMQKFQLQGVYMMKSESLEKVFAQKIDLQSKRVPFLDFEHESALCLER